jgi:hypothetical protein
MGYIEEAMTALDFVPWAGEPIRLGAVLIVGFAGFAHLMPGPPLAKSAELLNCSGWFIQLGGLVMIFTALVHELQKNLRKKIFGSFWWTSKSFKQIQFFKFLPGFSAAGLAFTSSRSPWGALRALLLESLFPQCALVLSASPALRSSRFCTATICPTLEV